MRAADNGNQMVRGSGRKRGWRLSGGDNLANRPAKENPAKGVAQLSAAEASNGSKLEPQQGYWIKSTQLLSFATATVRPSLVTATRRGVPPVLRVSMTVRVARSTIFTTALSEQLTYS